MTNEKDNIVDHEDHAPAATPAPENAVSEKTKQTPGVTERNVGGSSSSVHEESTFSPELTNALAQEYTGIWTKEMLKLLPIVTVGFLSQLAYPVIHFRSFTDMGLNRLLHEWVRRFYHVWH